MEASSKLLPHPYLPTSPGGAGRSSLPLLLLSTSLFVVAAVSLARIYPPVNLDEVIVAVNGDSVLRGNGIRYSISHDIVPIDVVHMAENSNHVIRPLYDAWVGLWVRFVRNITLARGSSIIVAAGLLLAILWWGTKSGGTALACLCGFILLSSPIFWLSACVINEHGLLSLFVATTTAIITSARLTDRGALICGIAAGIALAVHQNMAPIIPGLFILGSGHARGRSRLPSLLALAAGTVVGGLLSLSFMDLQRFLLFQKSLYWTFAKPPLIDGNLGTLWGSIWARIWGVSTFYFSTTAPLPAGWALAARLFMVALLVAALPGAVASHDGRIIGLSLATILVLMGLTVRRQEVMYSIALYPFYLLLLREHLRNTTWRLTFLGRALWAIAFLCMAGSIFFHVSFIRTFIGSEKSFKEIVGEVNALIDPERPQRIVGPSPLWFARSGSEFRDVGSLNFARYFTGGVFEPGYWMAEWKPDVLIADNTYRRALSGAGSKTFLPPVPIPCRYLGTVDTGNVYGRWDAFRLEWGTGTPTGFRAEKKRISNIFKYTGMVQPVG